MSESDIFGYLFPPYVPPIIPAAPAAPRILRDEKYPPHRLSNQYFLTDSELITLTSTPICDSYALSPQSSTSFGTTFSPTSDSSSLLCYIDQPTQANTSRHVYDNQASLSLVRARAVEVKNNSPNHLAPVPYGGYPHAPVSEKPILSSFNFFGANEASGYDRDGTGFHQNPISSIYQSTTWAGPEFTKPLSQAPSGNHQHHASVGLFPADVSTSNDLRQTWQKNRSSPLRDPPATRSIGDGATRSYSKDRQPHNSPRLLSYNEYSQSYHQNQDPCDEITVQDLYDHKELSRTSDPTPSYQMTLPELSDVTSPKWRVTSNTLDSSGMTPEERKIFESRMLGETPDSVKRLRAKFSIQNSYWYQWGYEIPQKKEEFFEAALRTNMKHFLGCICYLEQEEKWVCALGHAGSLSKRWARKKDALNHTLKEYGYFPFECTGSSSHSPCNLRFSTKYQRDRHAKTAQVPRTDTECLSCGSLILSQNLKRHGETCKGRRRKIPVAGSRYFTSGA